MSEYLPPCLSVPVAAILAGRSQRDLRRQADVGLIEAEGGGDHRRRIPLATVERLRGAPVTGADYLAALAHLAPARERQNLRNRARRGG